MLQKSLPQSVDVPTFRPATRIHTSVTASVEKRVLIWLAQRIPDSVSADHLTVLGLLAQIGAGCCYLLARTHSVALLGVCACIALNWLGDSLDGTLARVRNQQRPRYGFYVDHMVDLFGALALMVGLGFSGLVHWPVACALLLGFLLLSGESYLATYTLGRFELSQGLFGPTELRLLLIAGNLALIRSPYVSLAGHHLLLLDLGGAIAAAAMLLLTILLTIRHTAQLAREEPLA